MKKTSGIRYDENTKRQVCRFVFKHNEEHGRGGISAAARHFDIAQITVSKWLKMGEAAKPKKPSSSKPQGIPEVEKIDPLERVDLPNFCPCCSYELGPIYAAMNLPKEPSEVDVLRARVAELEREVAAK